VFNLCILTQINRLSAFLLRIISIGADNDLGDEFNDRLRVVNIFTWTCIIFCTPYYLIMLVLENYETALIFFIVQFLFSVSLWLNKFHSYKLAKLVILFTTNYAVLCLNFIYGHDSGFFLYYFTSPLIVFTVYNIRQRIQSIISLTFYLVSYVISEVIYHYDIEPWIILDKQTITILYYFNVILAFCFLIVLARNFSKFHKDAYEHVNLKNLELHENQNELQQLLKDKNTLLSETHHRVKNNLAIIRGIFDLQMMYEKNPTIKEILTNSKNRIKSMSLVHESLYDQSKVSQIDFKDYTEFLVREIQNTLQTDKHIDVSVSIENIFFDLSKAIPCGLIINEVLTNSFKHAFKSTEDPQINIELKYTDQYYLSIKDNGTGFDYEGSNVQNSLGLTLIDALSRQLGGEFYFENKNGSNFYLIFK